jgi:predicted metal-binding protein
MRELVERSAGPLAACLGTAFGGNHPSTGFAMDQSASNAAREEAPSEPCDVAATLHVCVTCVAGEDRETVLRAGRRLHDALVEAQRRQDYPPRFRIVEAECLSNCNRGCSVALSGPGRWSYVYGDLGQASVEDLLAGASRYAATKDGLVPWRERPTIFRKGVIARIPPSL